jgi:hypothetical protein
MRAIARVRDSDIRRSLRVEVRRLYANDPDALIVDELGLSQGDARVDLAVVNGSLHGYEIKSDFDTLRRLPSQCNVYGRTLDFVTIVVSAKHAKAIRAIIPRWWGIWTVVRPSAERVEFRQVRAPRHNVGVSAAAVAELLWRDEVLEELAARALARGLRAKPRRELWQRLATSLPLTELCAVVRERLKRREHWRVPARRE